MANRIVAGLAAGAAGTLALNVTSYLDMVVRGRPASELPGRVAGRIADEVGMPLTFDLSQTAQANGNGGDSGAAAAAAAEKNRQAALGALLGYANGLAIGLTYAIVRLVLPRPPTWLAGAALGSLAMAASDYPATRLGLTDPKTWSGADWMADVVPHMAYGVAAAFTFEAIRK